jgi:hypothetical protein
MTIDVPAECADFGQGGTAGEREDEEEALRRFYAVLRQRVGEFPKFFHASGV